MVLKHFPWVAQLSVAESLNQFLEQAVSIYSFQSILLIHLCHLAIHLDLAVLLASYLLCKISGHKLVLFA